jgi:hypothetical protein
LLSSLPGRDFIVMPKLLPSFSIYFSYACNVCTPHQGALLDRLLARSRAVFA